MKIPVTLLLVAAVSVSANGYAQQNPAARRAANRDAVEKALKANRDRIEFPLVRSESAPFSIVGNLTEGLAHVDALEVIIGVSSADTISVSAYPHYRGGYINIDRLQNAPGLMRQLLRMNDTNFMFWAVDGSGDLYARYTFTLESGIPDESLVVVLRSLKNLDQFVGDMRPNIDGTSAPTR